MKRVYVSGGSKGIGAAIALRFAQSGDEVLVSARNAPALDALSQKSEQIKTFVSDLSQKQGVEDTAQWVLEQGPLDILVNNAGVFIPSSFLEESEEDFHYQMQLNLNAPYFLTRRLLPHMLQRNTGKIYNICSTASTMAYPNGASYCISKHALLGFSRVLREELKSTGLQVISVMPGATYTASWDGVDLPEERLMPPEDIAEVIYCSAQLSERTVLEELLLRPQLGDL